MIVLHRDAPVPDTVKLLIALEEAGTGYETRRVDVAGFDHWSDAHREIAPQGQVPVLVAGGEPMADAQYALQYVGEALAPGLVPDDPWHWYELQALNQRIDAAIGPSVNLLGWTAATSAEDRAAYRARLAAVPGREKPAGWFAVWADAEAGEDQLANARERIGEALDELEARLEGQDWLVGARFSLADVDAFALVRAVRAVLPQALAERPGLGRWLDRVAGREAVRRATNGLDVAFAAPA
jgi:glutathione S-transferase